MNLYLGQDDEQATVSIPRFSTDYGGDVEFAFTRPADEIIPVFQETPAQAKEEIDAGFIRYETPEGTKAVQIIPETPIQEPAKVDFIPGALVGTALYFLFGL